MCKEIQLSYSALPYVVNTHKNVGVYFKKLSNYIFLFERNQIKPKMLNNTKKMCMLK